MFRPKIIATLKNYSIPDLTKDTMAGLIVGIVALPLAIAFAIASGAAPEKGIITAIIAGFIISALGGSRVQIGGPTGAFVIIVYGIIHKFGYNGLIMATVMAGIILIIFGLTKIGAIIKFIPHSVIVGFTFGIAILIFTGQISEFLGLGLTNLPADFIDKLKVIGEHISAVNPYASLIAIATIAVIRISAKINRMLPGSLIALLVASMAVYVFNIPVETIGARFGDIPNSFPAPGLPTIDLKTIRGLLNPAFTIAILGAIESLLSAVVSDGMIGGKHRSNTELIAQGVANIASPLFGGLPATGAIARTATNVKSGGRTPVAGIIHALTLLLIMMFFGKLVAYIPLSCLAGILMLVAYHMSEWRSVASLLKISRGSALTTIVTVSLTLLVDLTVAIEVGMIVAIFVFARRMSRNTFVYSSIKAIEDDTREEDIDGGNKQENRDFREAQKCLKELPAGAVMYEISGPLFFGAAYKFREAMAEIDKPPKVLILQMKHVPVIDGTGIHVLTEEFKALKKFGTKFIITGINSRRRNKLERGGILNYMETGNLCGTTQEAIDIAHKLIP